MTTDNALSLPEVRRISLQAQGFGREPSKPTLAHVARLAERLVAVQLDSVNVLVRSHYLPLYSRLGPYRMSALDELAYRRRALFETWLHATCLVPVRLYTLQRYRTWPIRELSWIGWPRGADRSTRDDVAAIYDEIAEHGPLAASELAAARPRTSSWWGWDRSKVVVETLLDCGLLAVAGRRGFTRLYDIAERVIPAEILETETLGPEESQRELLMLAARAVGVGTAKQIAAYLGLRASGHRTLVQGSNGRWLRPDWKSRIAELVEDGRLEKISVQGWTEPGYLLPGTRVPKPMHLRALLSPFDSFIRVSAELLCGFTNPLSQQLFVPAERRQFGYYVLPFLLGETLVGRCDLKADRQRGVLMVQSAYLEPGQNARDVAGELAEELHRLRGWLELGGMEVAERGNLAGDLRQQLIKA
ncbi:winged helix-turn-helix domain-containing protein [Microlunatus soli]|uniref:Winged helix-turn-helix domain-containing protein n=1 Tax=Microlunatus soli TaxID=630515 RepID=A0A1H1RRH0_9ACTN|nr:crosslink repair DNA glycosylase YcaQ family protein [Microlunatus soli]SDS38273.1 hypothetical protein SAMN04489812_1741 [Microlunatus soli]